jgi:hypothetical protein
LRFDKTLLERSDAAQIATAEDARSTRRCAENCVRERQIQAGRKPMIEFKPAIWLYRRGKHINSFCSAVERQRFGKSATDYGPGRQRSDVARSVNDGALRIDNQDDVGGGHKHLSYGLTRKQIVQSFRSKETGHAKARKLFVRPYLRRRCENF